VKTRTNPGKPGLALANGFIVFGVVNPVHPLCGGIQVTSAVEPGESNLR